jgi:hypothetical protein
VSWSKKLPGPIKLRDGRELATLSDARSLILDLTESRRARPTWLYATELILRAAETGKRADLAEARRQIARAASADGILARNWPWRVRAEVDPVAKAISDERLPVQSRLAFNEHHSRGFLGVGGFFAQRNVRMGNELPYGRNGLVNTVMQDNASNRANQTPIRPLWRGWVCYLKKENWHGKVRRAPALAAAQGF